MNNYVENLYQNIHENIELYKSNKQFSNIHNSKIVKYYLNNGFTFDTSFTFAIMLQLFLYYNI